jgi:hypothetical protein
VRSNLGIKFTPADQAALFKVLAAAVFYFLTAFVLYGATDLMEWASARFMSQHNIMLAEFDEYRRRRRERRGGNPSPEEEREEKEREELLNRSFSSFERQMSFLNGIASTTGMLRVLFEFVLPILVGLYAFVVLLTATPELAKPAKRAALDYAPRWLSGYSLASSSAVIR